jgi:TPP-dependent pyruvate/acetoin dehydrogenase alpha subunit
MSAIDKSKDIIFSNHRGHGHYLAYCSDIKGLVAEIMGLQEGVCAGVGGSQHIQRQNLYTNGIQGAAAPIVVGMALAEKYKQTGAVSILFLGDGTFGEGALYEAMNIAALWSVPMLFVVEHNRYAQSTPTDHQHAGDLARRSEPFGIPLGRVDGMDVNAVYRMTAEAIAEIRGGSGPRMLLLDTYRFAPHSKGDDFRNPEEIANHRLRDPLTLCKNYIESENIESITKQVRMQVNGVLEELGVPWG